MLSSLFHGPGKNKGASYFHPDHGLVDYISSAVKGPAHRKDISFLKAPQVASAPGNLPACLAAGPTSAVQLVKPGQNLAAAELVKFNPASLTQWHSHDILRADMTKDPELVRTMRLFHGAVWRHRPEFRAPIVQGLGRAWQCATIPMLGFMIYNMVTGTSAKG